MQLDPTLIGPIVVAAGVIILGLVVWAMMRRRRSNAMRERYGTEYDHTVETAGSQKAAEHELREREKLAEKFEIRPLALEQKRRFADEWQRIEARFVERPTTAVVEAEEMIQDVLRHRGFPVRNHDGIIADLTTHRPALVNDYRSAHGIINREDPSEMTTEELRKAMLHYSALYDDLVGPVPRRAERADNADTEVPIETVQETEAAGDATADRRRRERRRADEQRVDRELR